MRAAILAVGTELLGTERLDTNSLVLTACLARQGVTLQEKSVAGDDAAQITAALIALRQRVDLVLVTGGLGPTADDRTRAGVAAAFGRTLAPDPALRADLEAYEARRGRTPNAPSLRQIERIAGAEALTNPNGSAPGQRLEADGTTVFLFPGVPSELTAMIDLHLEPWLVAQAIDPARRRVSQPLQVASIAESRLEARLAPYYERFGTEALALLASPGAVRLRVEVGGEDREAALAARVALLTALLGDDVFAHDEETTLAGCVGASLLAAGRRVAVAESCTGGLLGERLTRVAGSSGFFPGGVIAYANAVKVALLGVDAEQIEAHGAVSEPVAGAMARGVAARLGSDFGIGITGIAGPGGGSETKPVGTVFIGLAGPADDGDARVTVQRHRFHGDRHAVRWQSCQMALDRLRRRLVAIA